MKRTGALISVRIPVTSLLHYNLEGKLAETSHLFFISTLFCVCSNEILSLEHCAGVSTNNVALLSQFLMFACGSSLFCVWEVARPNIFFLFRSMMNE